MKILGLGRLMWQAIRRVNVYILLLLMFLLLAFVLPLLEHYFFR